MSANVQTKEEPTPAQAVMDEANAFIHDIMLREINPSDVVIAYREAGGGFGMYVAGRTDPLVASGLLAHAQAAVTKQAADSVTREAVVDKS